MSQLKRTLGLTECVFFGVGSILGTGIYALIGIVAGEAGNMLWLSFGIASFTALCTAFSYAELSSMFPSSGGEFVYAKAAFGKKIGSVFGLLISLNGIITGAVVSLGFGGYLSALTGWPVIPLALIIILLIFLINSLGIRESSTFNIIFTCVEFSGLLFVVWTALPHLGSVNYFELPPKGFQGIVTGSILGFFAYVGFEEMVKLAEETKNPEKVIPKALFLTLSIVLTTYIIVAVSVVSVLPFEKLSEVENPMAAVIESRYGSIGLLIISVIALFATSNTVLSNMIGSSRVLYDMSDEIKELGKLNFVWKVRKTPVAALAACASLMLLFALIGDIGFVALIATLAIFATFTIVNLSLIVLRFRQSQISRPYRVPLNIGRLPIISLFGLGLTLAFMLYNLWLLIWG